MDELINAYSSLDAALKFYWIVAVGASLIFLVQMVLTLIGIGDTDADAGATADLAFDSNGDTLDTGGAIQLFSVRNVVNFLIGVGWGGVCFWNVFENKHIVTIVSFICGLAFLLAFLWMYKMLMKLQRSGNFQIQACVGMTCSVYLRIPASRTGSGKVQLSYHGSVLELEALTDGPLLPTGSKVKVLEVIDGHSLLVEAL